MLAQRYHGPEFDQKERDKDALIKHDFDKSLKQKLKAKAKVKAKATIITTRQTRHNDNKTNNF